MIITIEEGRDTLRVDGEDLDMIIIPLIEAIPVYLQTTTGNDWIGFNNPLAKTTAKFILQLWFDPQSSESERLKKIIDGLLTVLTTEARGITF